LAQGAVLKPKQEIFGSRDDSSITDEAMTNMLRLLVAHAVFAIPAITTTCEVGKEDLVGTSKYFTVQVCNLFGATCYMNHVSLNSSECASKALKIPHETCALFPIISYQDNNNADPASLLTGTRPSCSISCNYDGEDCKFSGACVSVQCSLGGNSWAGAALSSPTCRSTSSSSRYCTREGSVTDTSKSSSFEQIPIMSLYSTSKTVLLSRAGTSVAATTARAGSKLDEGSKVGLVGMFPAPTAYTIQSGPAACPSSNKLMSEVTETAAQLRTCTIGVSGGKKYMYAGVANLLADTGDLNGYSVSRRVAIDGTVTHSHSGARRRRTFVPFMGGVLQRYTDSRSDRTWPACFQFSLRKGTDGPIASWEKSSAVMESAAFAPNSVFPGETAGTYRNYVAIFYCTDYARTDLTTCGADKAAVFYVADPSPALHFGKTAESIATKLSVCPSGESDTPKVVITTPVTPPKVVTMKLTLKNLDYQKLVQSATLKAAFIAAVKKVIAGKAGANVLAEHITLVLSSGSVVVDATIDTVAAGVDHGNVHSALTSAKAAVESDLVAEVKQVAGIASIQTGDIEVVSETVPIQQPAPIPTSGSITLKCSLGLTLGIFLTACSFMQ